MAALVDINNPKEVGREKLRLQGGRQPQQQQTDSPLSNSTSAPISRDTARKITDYFQTALQTYITQFNIRPQMVMRDLAYYREKDFTRTQLLAKAANQMGDTSKLQNVTIPVVMPQVESALSYLTGVFLTGYPIFGVVPDPEQIEAIEQMETVIADNSNTFGWSQELMKCIRKGLKYDLGAVEVIWEKRMGYRIGTPELKQLTQGTPQEVLYEGNRIKDLDPYNLILDTRVSPDRNHLEGEFAGYTELVGPVILQQRMEELDPLKSMNFKDAFNAPSTGAVTGNQTSGYYTPVINPDALLPAQQNQPFSWSSFFSISDERRDINYQSAYEWTVLYLKIIPRIFGIRVQGANKVQIWKFIIVNRTVVIFAEQQTNAHGLLPIIVCKPSNDGMMWQSKSFSQNAEPYQDVASSLVNSALESQRRKVYDRIFYDANRINKKDIDNVSPVARIPVKNSQYNKDIASAIHVAPYRDEGVSDILAFAQNVQQMADFATGQNRVQQGQFQKGNKTKVEFQEVMNNSNARQQMAAIALESTFFGPIKAIIKSNILQYQPPSTLFNQASKVQVDVDPAALRKAALSFKVSDGLLPTSKIANTDTMGSFLQAAMAMPALQAEYDLAGMVIYNMKLQGSDWLDDFKRSPQDQQQYMQTMQQASKAAGDHRNSQPPQQPQQQQQPQGT